MIIREYDREEAVAYAHQWAFARNPGYYDFSKLGGDCTNFISQCVYAGSGVMNEKPVYGWYYHTLNDRTASWTGAEYFYRFIAGNQGRGPFGYETSLESLQTGDVIQLTFDGWVFSHSVLVVAKEEPVTPQTVWIATHSVDSDNRPLASYSYERARYIHLFGVRV